MKKIILAGIFFVTMMDIATAEMWINEFVSDPLSGLASDEWIEIYTDTSLEGCKLREAGGYETPISGGVGIVLFMNPAGVLNNDRDTISLYCNDALVDEISYTGNVPGKGKSLGRDQSMAWIVYDAPTPGVENYGAVVEDTPIDQTPMETPVSEAPEFSTYGALLVILGCGIFAYRRNKDAWP